MSTWTNNSKSSTPSWTNSSRNSASWVNVTRSTAGNSMVLMESGSYILLETGDKIILEQSVPGTISWTNAAHS